MNAETPSKITPCTTTLPHAQTPRQTFVRHSIEISTAYTKPAETQKSATLSAIADKDQKNSKIHDPATRAANCAAIAETNVENFSRHPIPQLPPCQNLKTLILQFQTRFAAAIAAANLENSLPCTLYRYSSHLYELLPTSPIKEPREMRFPNILFYNIEMSADHFSHLLRSRPITILFLVLVTTSMASAQPAIYYHQGTTRKISQLTGDWDYPLGIPTLSQTETRAALGATDLGSSFEHEGKLVFLFGDTWRGHDGYYDTLGVSTSTDPWQLEMDIPTGNDGKWRPMFPPGLTYGVFCIPSHGISVDGKMYVVYTQDGIGGLMKRSFLISSDDDGATWETLYQLDNYSDSNPRFVNVYLIEHDDFIYMFGSGAYRASSPMLARAPKSQFPNKSAWQYYSGLTNGIPIWSSQVDSAATLFTHNVVGEFSCEWIDVLNCWVMLYNSGGPRGITMRSAAQPWGPWSPGTVIMSPSNDQPYGNYMHISWDAEKRDLFSDLGRENEWGGDYGPYLIPRFTGGTADHCEIYYTMSTWNPYQVVLMRSILSATPPPTPLPTNSETLDHSLWHRSPADVADAFDRDGRPHLTTYTTGAGDDNTGWLWQRLPKRTTELSFKLHGGHGEIFLLENAVDLPEAGDVEIVAANLRNGMYGRVARRATGVNDNSEDIDWSWHLRNLDTSSLVLVVLDATTEPWGFLSFSDMEAEIAPAPAAINDWVIY